MMRRVKLGGMVAALVVMVGCEDLLVDLPETELTTEESTELAEVLGDLVYDVADDESGDPLAQGAFVPQDHGGANHWEGTLTVIRPCPEGGQVMFEGALGGARYPEEDRTVVEISASKTPAACVITVGDEQFTIDGDPSLDVTARIERVGGELSGEQNIEIAGGFTWSTDSDRAGECDVDLTLVFDAEAQSRSVSGTFCGTSIELTTGWSVD